MTLETAARYRSLLIYARAKWSTVDNARTEDERREAAREALAALAAAQRIERGEA